MANHIEASDYRAILKELVRKDDPATTLNGFVEFWNRRDLPVTLSLTGGGGDPPEEPVTLESLRMLPANLFQNGRLEELSPQDGEGLKGLYHLLDVVLENQILRRDREILERQIEESARYVTLGQLSRGVAHDFNNYLAGILGYTDLALRKAEEGTPARQMLELIHDNSLKTADFVKQLLQLSRKQGAPRGEINLQEIIEELLPLFRHLVKSDIKINTSINGGLWPFEGDASRIEQLLINLFLNARDAIPRGGDITLTAKNHEAPSGRLPGGSPCRPGGYVCFTLADTGCGIAPENLLRVFEPFYTTKEPGRGPGLGLTWARAIMEDHGGYIEGESEPARGTRFHLYFPGMARVE